MIRQAQTLIFFEKKSIFYGGILASSVTSARAVVFAGVFVVFAVSLIAGFIGFCGRRFSCFVRGRGGGFGGSGVNRRCSGGEHCVCNSCAGGNGFFVGLYAVG